MLIQSGPHRNRLYAKWSENRANPFITGTEGNICLTQGDWQVQHLAARAHPVGEIRVKKLGFLSVPTPRQSNSELVGLSLNSHLKVGSHSLPQASRQSQGLSEFDFVLPPLHKSYSGTEYCSKKLSV